MENNRQSFEDFVKGLVLLKNAHLITKRSALTLLYSFIVDVLHLSPEITLEEGRGE